MRSIYARAAAICTTCLSLLSFRVSADPLAGDIDLSTDVDAVDVQLVINVALGSSVPYVTDVNYDSSTNALDVQLVINAALGISIDWDGDGLCDSAETLFGTSPYLPDTDGDEVGDGQEVSQGTDPLEGVGGPPPAPADAASPIDETVATDLHGATEFLYAAANPVQTGVSPGTVEPHRAAVLRGRVTTRDGDPLSGVTITILNHPEYGTTSSRGDGAFDMAVNGGEQITARCEKEGYLPAQRHATVPWQDYVWLPDVALVPLDTQATVVDLSESGQAARGNPVTDDDGTRQSTLLFPEGATAELVLPGGRTQPISTLTIRAIEYSVGENGRASMPAELPPTSGYTYCVEITADEAVTAGANEVRLSQAVPFYLENFLDLPVGGAVPTGYYDYQRGLWIPSGNGRIIEVVDITGSLADLDTNGDGAADDAAALAELDISDVEREQLASLYGPGQSLWRVPITHFSCWDHNWPIGPPLDATAPNQPRPTKRPPLSDTSCAQTGPVIECSNQVLGAQVELPGTPFTLNYRSDRVPGRVAACALDIPLSGLTVPSSLKRIDLSIEAAGRLYTETFPPDPVQTYTFLWDRKDAYGRTLQGLHRANVRIGYTYTGVIQSPPEFEQSFALFGTLPITGSIARQEISIWQPWLTTLGNWDARAHGLGGWSLDIHHAYDPTGGSLYYGDGSSRVSERHSGQTDLFISTVAGTGVEGFDGDGGPAAQAQLDGPTGVAAAPDGSIYIADLENQRVRKVSPDGVISTVAGTGVEGFGGDGGPATQAQLDAPIAVAVGTDGSLYIADRDNHRVRRVAPDGTIQTIAGSGPTGSPWVGGFGGDGGPATQARLDAPGGIDVGVDQSIYIADTGNSRVRRIGLDGVITTVAGGGSNYEFGIPATQAKLLSPQDVSVGPDGSLYIPDMQRNFIDRVGPEGIITTVAGGRSGFAGDGGPAVDAALYGPRGVAVGSDNSFYISDLWNERIRMVAPDGVIFTIAGSGELGYGGDGGPATDAALGHPYGTAVGPDGSAYFVDSANHCIRKVSSPLPGFSGSDIMLLSEDGDELYHFSSCGRHLHTLDAETRDVIHDFEYDGRGLLVSVRDGDGSALAAVERDVNGVATAIVASGGERTEVEPNENGYAARIIAPDSLVAEFAYTGTGLLIDMKYFDGTTTEFTYDEMGLLVDE